MRGRKGRERQWERGGEAGVVTGGKEEDKGEEGEGGRKDKKKGERIGRKRREGQEDGEGLNCILMGS